MRKNARGGHRRDAKADLRSAGREHELALDAALKSTMAMLKDAGQPATDATKHAVLNTLRALPADEPAGRLTRDAGARRLRDARRDHAGRPRPRSTAKTGAREVRPPAEGQGDTDRKRRREAGAPRGKARDERAAAERAVRDAEQRARQAEFEAARAARDATKAERRLEEAQRELDGGAGGVRRSGERHAERAARDREAAAAAARRAAHEAVEAAKRKPRGARQSDSPIDM